MFAYCGNNPVSRADSGGCFWDIIVDVASLVISVIEVVQNPSDVGAWVGLALDVVDVAVPVVSGLGEAADAINAARKAYNTIDNARDTSKGWKLGDEVTKLTKAGNTPSWSTIRSRYWKNKAHYSPEDFSEGNLRRMKNGLAPLIEKDGKMYSMELHHPNGRKGENLFVFYEVTP